MDTSEAVSLPPAVREAYQKGGTSVPIVLLTDPGLKTIYGRYDHPGMKSQNYPVIFRNGRSAVAKALQEDRFRTGDSPPKVLTVSGAELEEWQSAHGSSLNARLTGVENGKVYLFQTEKGRLIRATASQLSPESVTRARKLAGLP